jgi:hypothetical protein
MLMVRRANMRAFHSRGRAEAQRAHRFSHAAVADSRKEANLLMDGENFMSATPAEVLEELKERRRHGDLDSGIVLEAVQGLPGFARDVANLAGRSGRESAIRLLDIRTLAERVFGDTDKVEAWLTRPNASLSNQKPIDLLEDELGTAVVREMLERIDHGIFA